VAPQRNPFRRFFPPSYGESINPRWFLSRCQFPYSPLSAAPESAFHFGLSHPDECRPTPYLRIFCCFPSRSRSAQSGVSSSPTPHCYASFGVYRSSVWVSGPPGSLVYTQVLFDANPLSIGPIWLISQPAGSNLTFFSTMGYVDQCVEPSFIGLFLKPKNCRGPVPPCISNGTPPLTFIPVFQPVAPCAACGLLAGQGG